MSLPRDIIRNILSEYIEYDELITLVPDVPGLYINPKRVQYMYTYHKNNKINSRSIVIDGDIRVKQYYAEMPTVCKTSEINYKNNVKNGKFTTWYTDGNIQYQCNYKNDKKDGDEFTFYQNPGESFQRIYKSNQPLNFTVNNKKEKIKYYCDKKIIIFYNILIAILCYYVYKKSS